MNNEQGWATFAARLASFESAVTVPTKKRVSTVRGNKTIAWPHKTPTPVELAKAGFYFKPSSTSNDNTVCYLCQRNLDGWEEDDDPIQEHLKHSSNCGWAILMNVSRDGIDPADMEDPTHSTILDARRATFGSEWPHESKRGWICKTEKMVEAGWYFAPTPESEDFVSCAYCKLSLDGWEPKDNPFNEHYRRSPECSFFVFAGTTAPKATKGKKPRVSKVARLSTQPTLAVSHESQPIPELDDSIDDTSCASFVSTASTMANKKGTRGKKTTKAKNAVLEAIETESSLVAIQSLPEPAKQTRGKKRTSDQISEDDRGNRESTIQPEPARKRRSTRTRDSVLRVIEYPSIVAEPEKMDVDDAPVTRVGRKRGSSVGRKTSVLKVTEIPAAVPDDATIDAALEADLNRPLSDEELSTVQEHKKKSGKSKKAKGSIISTNITSSVLDLLDEAVNTELQAGKPVDYETDVETKKATRKTKGKKMVAKKPNLSARVSTDSAPAFESHPKSEVDIPVATIEDDSGHETDASVTGKSIARKTSKRKIAPNGKTRKQGTRVVSKNIEGIFQAPEQSHVVNALTTAAQSESAITAGVDADQHEIDEKMAELRKEIDEEDAPTKKPSKAAKGKGKTSKSKKEKIPQLSMPGAFSPIVFDQSAEPSFASALSPTSPPMTSKLRTMFTTQTTEEEQMEIQDPEPETSPTPKRTAPPLPPRSSAKPTPTQASSLTKSALPRPTSTPTRPTQLGRQEMTASPSPQSSDAENAPPSSLPERNRPPLAPGTPKSRNVVIANASPSKIAGGLTSAVPWSAVDVEMIFQKPSAITGGGGDKENTNVWHAPGLTSPEKNMTVEEWVMENARRAEEELRAEAERVVSIFEREGQRALTVLEGIVCE